jgi:HEAT repeat protein
MTKTNVLALLALAASLSAQTDPNATAKPDPRAALARAVVLQEREFDRAGAAAEYARIAGDAAAPEEVRMEAKLRLGALKLLDGDEAGGRALLREVAESGSALAQRAQQLLAQKQQNADETKARVARALAMFAAKPADGAKELRFLGAPPAAPLAEQILNSPFDRGFLEQAVAVLLDLDDAVAAQTLATLRGRDTFVRRAVAPSLRLVQRERTDAEALRFLRDEDAEVRQWALRKLAFTAPADALLASMADAPDAVRSTLFAEWGAQEARQGMAAEEARRLAPLAAAEVTRQQPAAGLWKYVWTRASTAVADPRMLLQALRHSTCVLPQNMPVTCVAGVGDTLIDDVLATAEALASTADTDRRRTALRNLLPGIERTWTREVLTKRLRLAGLGFGEAGGWVKAHGTAADLPAVLDHLGDLYVQPMQGYLDKQTIPPERWRVFADHATRLRQHPLDDGLREREVGFAIYYLASTAQPDAMAWLVQHAAEDPEGLRGVSSAFRQASPSKQMAMADTCARLVDATLADGFEPDRRWPEERWQLRHWQHEVLSILIAVDPAIAAPRLAAAARAGVSPLLSQLLDAEARTRRLSDEQLTTTVAAYLASGRPEAVRNLVTCSAAWMVAPAYTVICDQALHIDPELQLDKGARTTARRYLAEVLQARRATSPPHADRLFVACMAQDDEGLITAAVIGRSAPGNARAPLDETTSRALATRVANQPILVAVKALAELGQPAEAEPLVALLGHADAQLRAYAIAGVIRMRGAAAVPTLLPLARDPDMRVRQAFCEAANKQLDRRFAPALVELLRDPDQNVRTQAQAALQATEFYVTQTERWQRLLTGTGLEATSAAEALIQQTKSSDQQVRLAAIRGLGALGVKEALPFLIQLMQDGDAEIAAAASAAAAALSR